MGASGVYFQVDKLHRRELKHDKFVEEVGHTLEYAAEHKSQLTRYGIIAAVAIVLVGGFLIWRSQQHQARQTALREALRIQDGQISPEKSDLFVTFPTQEEKNRATDRAWKDLATKYSGSDEGAVANFYLGTNAADQGRTADAEKYFKTAADQASPAYASQAKLSLAELYGATGRAADAERLLRDLIAKPTVLVSKEQATIALARLKAKTNPQEARKMLEPLRTETGAVSRAALTMLSELPAR